MRVITLFTPSLALCLGTQACEQIAACDLKVSPAVEVVITDSVTGQPRALEARGQVQDGVYTDSLKLYDDDGNGVWVSRAAAQSRRGIYTVTVLADGYQPWQVAGVRSRSGDCGVITVTLSARLVPTPP